MGPTLRVRDVPLRHTANLPQSRRMHNIHEGEPRVDFPAGLIVANSYFPA